VVFMATTKSTGFTSDSPDELVAIMRRTQEQVGAVRQQFINSKRQEEIKALEDELLDNYLNPSELELPTQNSPVELSAILSLCQNYQSRVTAIYAKTLSRVNILKLQQNTLQNALLSLIQGSSADARNAKVQDLTHSLNEIIGFEQNLVTLAELCMKNLNNIKETASRNLKALEMDINHFNGAVALNKINEHNREKYYKFGKESDA